MNTFNTLSSQLTRGGRVRYNDNYVITVVTTVFAVDSVLQKNLTTAFLPGKTYRFDQSHVSNLGYPLVFGLSPDSGTTTISGVTCSSYGTPGTPGAFTKLVLSVGYVAGTIYYYASTRLYMGYGPTIVTADVSIIYTNGFINFTVVNRKGLLAFSTSGVDPGDFTGSPAMSGDFSTLGLSTKQFQVNTTNSKYMIFTIDGIVKTVEINYIRYNVTVANNMYYLDGKKLADANFSANKTYVFTQTDNTNSGYPILFSTIPDGTKAVSGTGWSATTVTDSIPYGASYLAVSTGGSITFGNSFTYTINNSSANAITYTLSSASVPLVYTDLSFTNAAAITNVTVLAGVKSIVTCWNKTSAAKTVVLSSKGLASVFAILKGP